MTKEEDYYQLLGIAPEASSEQIKEAYLYKVNILHPDRLAAMPERIRRYDAGRVGNPEVTVDLGKTRTEGKPRPGVYPKTIRFDEVVPYVKQKGTFFIRNSGGSCRKVLISSTPEWIRVVKTASLQDRSKLPVQVNIEAVGTQWGKTYSAEIIVRLDESEARVKVILRTAKRSH